MCRRGPQLGWAARGATSFRAALLPKFDLSGRLRLWPRDRGSALGDYHDLARGANCACIEFLQCTDCCVDRHTHAEETQPSSNWTLSPLTVQVIADCSGNAALKRALARGWSTA